MWWKKLRGIDSKIGLPTSNDPLDCHGYNLKKYIKFLAEDLRVNRYLILEKKKKINKPAWQAYLKIFWTNARICDLYKLTGNSSQL